MQEKEEWMPLMEACERFKLSIHIIRRLIKEGKLEQKTNVLDKREKLINVTQLQKLLEEG